MESYFSSSAAETFQKGYQLGKMLSPFTVVCLFGELGAGKTTFVKGLVESATQLNGSIVQSPTFTYLNIYEGVQTVYHFDLYRLQSADDFLKMGFDEYFEAGGICCIEWSERLGNYLPSNSLSVHLTQIETESGIESGYDKRWIKINSRQ